MKLLSFSVKKNKDAKKVFIPTGMEMRSLLKGTKTIMQTKKINVEKLPLKPMSLEEARLQLEISNDKFIIFRNIENEEMNVLYQNSNSDLKLVRP